MKRSPQEQLKVLDKRLGAGIGAKRERIKLAKVIEDAKALPKSQKS